MKRSRARRGAEASVHGELGGRCAGASPALHQRFNGASL